jgi:hypothetical protein
MKHAHKANREEEARLFAALNAYEPVMQMCAGGCGRQVARHGARCIRCGNQRSSKANASSRY